MSPAVAYSHPASPTPPDCPGLGVVTKTESMAWLKVTNRETSLAIISASTRMLACLSDFLRLILNQASQNLGPNVVFVFGDDATLFVASESSQPMLKCVRVAWRSASTFYAACHSSFCLLSPDSFPESL